MRVLAVAKSPSCYTLPQTPDSTFSFSRFWNSNECWILLVTSILVIKTVSREGLIRVTLITWWRSKVMAMTFVIKCVNWMRSTQPRPQGRATRRALGTRLRSTNSVSVLTKAASLNLSDSQPDAFTAFWRRHLPEVGSFYLWPYSTEAQKPHEHLLLACKQVAAIFLAAILDRQRGLKRANQQFL